MLPLISPSTNQHCTHRAALLFLAADYTGGIAVGSLIPGRPLMGVHPVAPTEQTTSLWLVKGEIKFLRPSVGRLEIAADIEPERGRRTRSLTTRARRSWKPLRSDSATDRWMSPRRV